jgi:hypothetical protein
VIFGVRCTLATGEDVLITVEADDARAAFAEVDMHRRVFYGDGDGAGRWLAAQVPEKTLVAVHEAKSMDEWR